MERNYKPQCSAPRDTEQHGERRTFKRRGNTRYAGPYSRKPHGDFAEWFAFQSHRF